MDAVVDPSTTWRAFTAAWRSREHRADDVADPRSEREAEGLLRQYVCAVVVLSVTIAAGIGTAVMMAPSVSSVIVAIIVALELGYTLVLTELTAVPQTLRTIPALRSARLRRLRLATAVIGTVETALPLILAVALVVVSL